MERLDVITLWAISYFAALFAFVARITYLLGIADPQLPEDPLDRARWERRRRWLIIAEFSALPMFSTIAVLAAYRGLVDPVTAVIFALVSGALGSAFFLHALGILVSRRFGLGRSET